MKITVFIVSLFVTFISFSQEEEFLPINIEGKEAYMSTKTGEYTFLKHDKTDPTQLQTTDKGVIYKDISTHTVVKGQTLSGIAKKRGVRLSTINKYNKVSSTNLKIGQKIKIVKERLIKSSSPVVGTSGEERIIARLLPGQSPGEFTPPPPAGGPVQVNNQVIEVKKTQEKPSAKTYQVDSSKNPVFGLETEVEPNDVNSLENELAGLLNDAKQDVKNETVVTTEVVQSNVSQEELARQAKAEKLRQIRAEAKRLEAELSTETSKDLVTYESKPVNAVVVEQKETVAVKAQRLVEATKAAKLPVVKKQEVSTVEKAVKEPSKALYTHVVAKGDSFYGIAKKYNMSVDALMTLNDANSTVLDVGQKLKVHASK